MKDSKDEYEEEFMRPFLWLFLVPAFLLVVTIVIMNLHPVVKITRVQFQYDTDNAEFIQIGESSDVGIWLKNKEDITLTPFVFVTEDENCFPNGEYWCHEENPCIYSEAHELERIPPKRNWAYLITINVRNETRCEDGQAHPVTIWIKDINSGKPWDSAKIYVTIPHRR